MSDSTITAALREAADLLEAHPELPRPYITSKSNGNLELNWFLHINNTADSLMEQKRLAALIVKTVGGKWDKSSGDWDGGVFRFTQARGSLTFEVLVKRDAVCERIVIGTKTVTIPAKPATPERVVEQDDVEWRCEPLLAEVGVA